jgi:IPT/TIG domain-containing protein
VQIRCKGVLGSPVVRFGGVSASSVSIDGARTLITCTPPNGTCDGQPVDVAVASSTLPQSATRCGAFSYQDCTRIDSVVPGSGSTSGGTAVVINGRHFVGGTPAVSFGGNPASSPQVLDDMRISCVTPPGVGSVAVSVTNAHGSATVPSAFTYTSGGSMIPVAGPGALAAMGAAIAILAAWILRRRS